jgi:hypothetical protein
VGVEVGVLGLEAVARAVGVRQAAVVPVLLLPQVRRPTIREIRAGWEVAPIPQAQSIRIPTRTVAA